MSVPKTVVAWLDDGTCMGRFAESIARLLIVGTMNGYITGVVRYESGPLLDKARNQIVADFLQRDEDWLLMLDSDMVFPHTLLEDMHRWTNKVHVPVLGALCWALLDSGPAPTIFKVEDDKHFVRQKPPLQKGLVRVGATGAACLLTHRSVFEIVGKNLRPEERWFDRLYIDGVPTGEDVSFCARVYNQNIPMYVHTGIEVGHLKTIALDSGTARLWE